MFPDRMNITRLLFDLPVNNNQDRDHRAKLYDALIDNRYTDGEWPKHKQVETVGDLIKLGRDGLAQLCPSLDNASIEWLMAHLGVKRKPGRPKKIAA